MPVGNTCNGRYASGNCTAGAAAMFPDICKWPNLGNGGQWFGAVQGMQLAPTSQQPQAGWLASFHIANDIYGDVGLVQAVNGDGTITRFGLNWHLNAEWSTDRVPIDWVTGSFQPPGQFVPQPGYSGGAVTPGMPATGVPPGQGAGQPILGARGGPCQFGWYFPGLSIPMPQFSIPAPSQIGGPWKVGGGQITGVGAQGICFDGVVGGAAWALGAVGFVLAMVIAVRQPVQRAMRAVGGPAGPMSEEELVQRQAQRTEARRQAQARLEAQGRVPIAGNAQQGLSGQQRQTFRALRQENYSPVQARRGAQASGHGGTVEERVRTAKRHLGPAPPRRRTQRQRARQQAGYDPENPPTGGGREAVVFDPATMSYRTVRR